MLGCPGCLHFFFPFCLLSLHIFYFFLQLETTTCVTAPFRSLSLPASFLSLLDAYTSSSIRSLNSVSKPTLAFPPEAPPQYSLSVSGVACSHRSHSFPVVPCHVYPLQELGTSAFTLQPLSHHLIETFCLCWASAKDSQWFSIPSFSSSTSLLRICLKHKTSTVNLFLKPCTSSCLYDKFFIIIHNILRTGSESCASIS